MSTTRLFFGALSNKITLKIIKKHSNSVLRNTTIKYQYEHFSVIVDAASMETKNRVRLALDDGGYTCFIVKDHEIFNSYHRGVKPLLDWLDAGTDLRGGIARNKRGPVTSATGA